jgi:P-type Mg2+ transporter
LTVFLWSPHTLLPTLRLTAHSRVPLLGRWMLFALAIAVGITPQLLPAVVSASLATGSRRLAKLKVLVKPLVCITCASVTSLKLVTLRTGGRLHRRHIA